MNIIHFFEKIKKGKFKQIIPKNLSKKLNFYFIKIKI